MIWTSLVIDTPPVAVIFAPTVTAAPWVRVMSPASMAPPVLSKPKPVLENAPPLVSIAALISTFSAAWKSTFNMPEVEVIGALMMMLSSASSVSVEPSPLPPSAFLVMAALTVMVPFVVAPPLAVWMMTLEPASRAALILATSIVVTTSSSVGLKVMGPGSPAPIWVMLPSASLISMSSGSSSQVPPAP